MKSRRNWLAAICTAALPLALLPAIAGQCEISGRDIYVTGGGNGAAVVYVSRQGATRPASPIEPLRDRDIVMGDGRSTLYFDVDGRFEPRQAYRCEIAVAGPQSGWLPSAIASLFDRRADKPRRVGVGLGDTLVLRFHLQDGNSKVLEGDRRLALAWDGGFAPYTVAFYQDGKTGPVAGPKTVALRNIVITTATRLHPGKYRVTVTDSLHRTAVGAFEVVGRNALPALPDLRFPPGLSERSRFALAAMALAQTGGHNWAYEAYLEASAFADPAHPLTPLEETARQAANDE